MNTKANKRASVRLVITLLAMALPMGLMPGIAGPAFALPEGAPAYTAQMPEARSNMTAGPRCHDCELQLYVSKLRAAKPNGEHQPIDLSVQVTDDYGNPIVGAKVMARVTDFETFVDGPLTDMGNGRYSACAFGYLNGWGARAVRIHVRAQMPGYWEGAGDGTNHVGRLCPVPGSDPVPSK